MDTCVQQYALFIILFGRAKDVSKKGSCVILKSIMTHLPKFSPNSNLRSISPVGFVLAHVEKHHLHKCGMWGFTGLWGVDNQVQQGLSRDWGTQTDWHQFSELGLHSRVQVYHLHVAAAESTPSESKQDARAGLIKHVTTTRMGYWHSWRMFQLQCACIYIYIRPLTLPCSIWRWSGRRPAPLCWNTLVPSQTTLS